MPFKKGQSGNASGRPVGALNKKTQELRSLLDSESQELIKKAIELAKDGDVQALRLCLERILPPIKDTSLYLALPRLGKTASSVLTFSKGVINAVVRGEITPTEGEMLMGIVEKYGKAIDLKDLEMRLLTLEDSISKKGWK